MTTRLAGGYLKERVRDTLRSAEQRATAAQKAQFQQARMVADRLSRLRGAAMKVGQQAAVLAAHLDLPQDLQDTLGRLHADAEPTPFPLLRDIIIEELGPIEDAFASLDEAPLGTASLAQAHAATLPDGREVVVKVLHPGVDEHVRADLLALKAMFVSARALGRDKRELDEAFAELSERLMEELDYLIEAGNIHAFTQAFAGDERYRIPQHHPALCTERVLTLDRLRGVPIQRFVADASEEARQRAGIGLAELFLTSTFRHRLLHADPHPGNYLFEPDGRIGILDFGCVKRFTPFWIGAYAKLVLCALERDQDGLLRAVQDLDAWDGSDEESAELILAFCEAVLDPLRSGNVHTIGGSDDDITERVAPIITKMWTKRDIRGPRDLIFLHRTLGGMYTLARQLHVTADWEQMLRPHLEYAIANG